ncbi:glutaredoxin-related protein [Dunaliella salina]|uniref:Glutaredoxin-related protein n=1 Tax=Dunaliella salina TaxID=3046 RepID=A0ABQ7GEQ9_DUNSA|nr:glutaredoxin-related protein [Dunaliella salina]|eukprot:KAF5833074.1 glutaredoxin-related protein [Dunaliella salina]
MVKALCNSSQCAMHVQVYIGGEFVGGADIMIQMFQSGELKELLERELNS